jgi:acyl-CoA reductase-like NAD-dependent aldehyde dehydrogenase
MLENAKPISQARGEIDHCIACFETEAAAARLLHGDSYNSLGDKLFGMVLREPIGVVGLITPWNFPFLILCERVPIILASGCTMVVKPSEVTSVTTLMPAEILQSESLVWSWVARTRLSCLMTVTLTMQQLPLPLASVSIPGSVAYHQAAFSFSARLRRALKRWLRTR